MTDLLGTIQTARNIITEKLLAYVKENGEDYSQKPDYWANEFGIYEEDGCKVTKVLDFYGNNGCEAITQRNTNPDIDLDLCDSFDELLEIVDDNFTHTSFMQLYIEVDADGNEELKYYCFYNTGIYHSDGLSEPEHGNVSNLNLSELENIIFVINKDFENNKN